MPNSNFKTLIGCVILLAGIIGYVLLAVLLRGDPDAANIRGSFIFLLAPATALLIGGQIDRVEDRAKTIERQTNGALTKRIETVAHRAATVAIEQAIEHPDIPTGNSSGEPS